MAYTMWWQSWIVKLLKHKTRGYSVDSRTYTSALLRSPHFPLIYNNSQQTFKAVYVVNPESEYRT